MTAEQKKLLRDALMAALVTAAPVSLPLSTLKSTARAAGFKVDEDELEAHLHYLTEKELIRQKKERVSAAVKRWEPTAAGIEYAEEEGLV